jgi:hypothetical protein
MNSYSLDGRTRTSSKRHDALCNASQRMVLGAVMFSLSESFKEKDNEKANAPGSSSFISSDSRWEEISG